MKSRAQREHGVVSRVGRGWQELILTGGSVLWKGMRAWRAVRGNSEPQQMVSRSGRSSMRPSLEA